MAGYFFNNEKLTKCEIFAIFGGFIGVVILTNEHLFQESAMKRHLADLKHYPYYCTGIFMALGYTTFSTLNFYEMR